VDPTIGLCDLGQLGQTLGYVVPARIDIIAIVTLLYAVLLVPALLAWIGASPRRRVQATGLVVVGLVVPMYWTGVGREYTLVVRPAAFAVYGVLAALALANEVRRSRFRLRQLDAFWICVALLVNFATMLIRMPLIEPVYAHSHAAARGLHSGRMVLESLLSTAMAYGILQRRPSAPIAAAARQL
jgi:hypothetical protein